MVDQPNHSPSDDDQAPNAAEARALLDALLDDLITDEGTRRLEELATTDPAIARIYVRAMHLWSQLPLHLGVRHSMPPMWQAEATNELLSETMVVTALNLESRAEDTFEDEGEIFQPGPMSIQPPPERTIWQKVHAFGKWIGIAAVVLLCAGLGWLVWPAGPPAVVTATAGMQVNGGMSLQPGSRIPAGESIDLKQGGIEMRFGNGATVTIAGPARFRLDQKNSMTLYRGVLAAHVPHNTGRFSVSSPGLKVVDLGTTFGVRTIGDDQGSEAAVFEGNVTAAATDTHGKEISTPVPMPASTAMAHTLGGGTQPLASVYTPDEFPRDISRIRLPLKLFDTGTETDPTGGDPHWQVLQVASHPDWVPQSASLFHPAAIQIRLPAAVCICPRGVSNPPPAGEYIFRTTVDLSGFDTDTAVVVANLLATEATLDVRINGSQAIGTSMLDASNGDQPRSQGLRLPNGFWKPGINTIDFVVNYLPDDMPKYAFAGLCVAWDASASPVVNR